MPFREEDGYPEETNAPYGVAKKALLVMLQAYRDQYGLCGIYLVSVNLYGAGDTFDPATSHVVPALIRKFVAARAAGDATVEVWGTGAASREFLYVDDAARGIVEATLQYDDPDPVSLSAGHEVTNRELVYVVRDITGYKAKSWKSCGPRRNPTVNRGGCSTRAGPGSASGGQAASASRKACGAPSRGGSGRGRCSADHARASPGMLEPVVVVRGV